ncbi:hypothetical protein [Komagataeibacter sp. FNDCR2]|uniref:hypothetical protein n=1 Tax=Komagataeibacter sp. FNDCR2 TaxID=2878682 RepID=UPI001E349613|nr:hypothetical protein [Komagataeibacter sp. FNDCR2]MCE2574381.1 hypothetical protein [Komagataeibacter sp. FNDCR2]
MADISTISTAIATALATALCPDGTPGSACTGRPLVIRRGGLTQADLAGVANTLQNGCDFIGIMDEATSWARVDEPLGRPWRFAGIRPASLTISAQASTATVTLAPDVAPTGTVGLVVSGLAGITGNACTMHVAAMGDTAQSVAAALAAPLPGAVVDGPVITIPDARDMQAINADVVTARCIARRQQQMFVLTAWSATPAGRDALGCALSDALALTDWMTDADGSTFRIEARAAFNDDTAMNRGMFSRPAHFLVTYDTELTRPAPVMLAGGIGLPGGLVTGDLLLGAPLG